MALPINGTTWQVMRLSRNRNWGHPDLVRFLERLAAKAPQGRGWHGLLVGDMSQPRGGPMLTGHASHQVGLDADIWLTPMPDRELTREEREEMSATMMVRDDRLRRRSEGLDADASGGDPRRGAGAEVQRIFVNAAIKKALCRDAGSDRDWLEQGAAVVGPRLSLPRPHQLPAGSPNASRSRRGRRTRAAGKRSRLLVHRCGAAPEAVAERRRSRDRR